MNGTVSHIGRNYVINVGPITRVLTRRDKALAEARALIAGSGGGALCLHWKDGQSLELVPAEPAISDATATVMKKLATYLDLRADEDTRASEQDRAEYELALALDEFLDSRAQPQV